MRKRRNPVLQIALWVSLDDRSPQMTWCSVAEQLTPLLEDANYYGVLRMRWCWRDRISVAG